MTSDLAGATARDAQPSMLSPGCWTAAERRSVVLITTSGIPQPSVLPGPQPFRGASRDAQPALEGVLEAQVAGPASLLAWGGDPLLPSSIRILRSA
jgi:hypothetical protein